MLTQVGELEIRSKGNGSVLDGEVVSSRSAVEPAAAGLRAV